MWPGFKELQARFPAVDEWMIGRGALADPFLPAAIKTGADPGPDRVRRFKAFYDDLFDRTGERLSGPGHLLDRMKGYWTYFAAAFTDGERSGQADPPHLPAAALHRHGRTLLPGRGGVEGKIGGPRGDTRLSALKSDSILNPRSLLPEECLSILLARICSMPTVPM